jgi:hypothetical protein
MRIVLGTFLLLHGLAHIAGFLKAWAPTRTTIIGNRIDLGVTWIKVVGLAWVVMAFAFGGAAIGAFAGVAAWPTFALAIAGASLTLCVLQLPETKFGVALNLALIAALLLGQRAGWF